MKFVHYMMLLLTCCVLTLSCNNNDGAVSIEEKVATHKTKSIFPFSKAVKTEILSYKSAHDTENPFTDILQDHMNNPARLKETLLSNKLNVKERIVLTKEQTKELYQLLYKTKCGDEIKGNCFVSRHAIVFYDKEDTPIAVTEISLDCATASISKGFTKFELCQSKVNLLKTYLQSIGITYFEEPVL